MSQNKLEEAIKLYFKNNNVLSEMVEKELLNESEPFQDAVKAKHSRLKKLTIGKGCQSAGVAGSPYSQKPDMKRSKSAPPIGEGKEKDDDRVLIDLGAKRRGEKIVDLKCEQISDIIKHLMGIKNITIPLFIIGSSEEIKSFVELIKEEIEYFNELKKDNSSTEIKNELDKKIEEFKNLTGLNWIFE